MGKYLAIDIGERMGRHILGYLENGKLQLEEIYRFESTNEEKGWDITCLFDEIKSGLKKCREIGKLPILVGIDTDRTDFVLLDSEDKILGSMVTYSDKDHFIDQLITLKEEHPDYLERAKTLLMLPDYLNFLLTGVKISEYTMAMTTQLLLPETQKWNVEYIQNLGYSADLLQEIRRPGAVVGNMTQMVTEEMGYDCIIILPATHAGGSAVFAFPQKEWQDRFNSIKPLLQADGSKTECSAAVIGNLSVQMIISHELKDIHSAHACIKNSFGLEEFT